MHVKLWKVNPLFCTKFVIGKCQPRWALEILDIIWRIAVYTWLQLLWRLLPRYADRRDQENDDNAVAGPHELASSNLRTSSYPTAHTDEIDRLRMLRRDYTDF